MCAEPFLSLKDQKDRVHKCSGELETLEVEQRALDGRKWEKIRRGGPMRCQCPAPSVSAEPVRVGSRMLTEAQ